MRVGPLGPWPAAVVAASRPAVSLDAPATVPLSRVRTLTAPPPSRRPLRVRRRPPVVETAILHVRLAGTGLGCSAVGSPRQGSVPALRPTAGTRTRGGMELPAATVGGAAPALASSPASTACEPGAARRHAGPAAAVIYRSTNPRAAFRGQVRLAVSRAAVGGSRGSQTEAGVPFRGIGPQSARSERSRCPDAALATTARAGFLVSGTAGAVCAKARKVLAEVAIVGCDDSAVGSWAGRELVGVPLWAALARVDALLCRAQATELVVRE
jgi:hypothetical protein